MANMDYLKEFVPISNVPRGALARPETQSDFRVSSYYASPTHTYQIPIMGGGLGGPFTEAGVDEKNGLEFVQGRWMWPSANTQIVTVPERPVDAGTWLALASGAQYVAPIRGVYLQPRQLYSSHQVAGRAPVQGVYTGFYDNSGDYGDY